MSANNQNLTANETIALAPAPLTIDLAPVVGSALWKLHQLREQLEEVRSQARCLWSDISEMFAEGVLPGPQWAGYVAEATRTMVRVQRRLVRNSARTCGQYVQVQQEVWDFLNGAHQLAQWAREFRANPGETWQHGVYGTAGDGAHGDVAVDQLIENFKAGRQTAAAIADALEIDRDLKLAPGEQFLGFNLSCAVNVTVRRDNEDMFVTRKLGEAPGNVRYYGYRL